MEFKNKKCCLYTYISGLRYIIEMKVQMLYNLWNENDADLHTEKCCEWCHANFLFNSIWLWYWILSQSERWDTITYVSMNEKNDFKNKIKMNITSDQFYSKQCAQTCQEIGYFPWNRQSN